MNLYLIMNCYKLPAQNSKKNNFYKMKINRYQDISEIDKDAKKDYIDRHSAFVHCD